MTRENETTGRRDAVMERHLRTALARCERGDFAGAQRNIEYARSRMADLIGPLSVEINDA
jgi:hypothetical protein